MPAEQKSLLKLHSETRPVGTCAWNASPFKPPVLEDTHSKSILRNDGQSNGKNLRTAAQQPFAQYAHESPGQHKSYAKMMELRSEPS